MIPRPDGSAAYMVTTRKLPRKTTKNPTTNQSQSRRLRLYSRLFSSRDDLAFGDDDTVTPEFLLTVSVHNKKARNEREKCAMVMRHFLHCRVRLYATVRPGIISETPHKLMHHS